MELPGFSSDIMILNIFLFLIGLAVLIKGSDWFVEAAAQIAREYKIPEIVIGLTLVSLGTSLPEFATDVYASIHHEGVIALGDIVGSNITNISLVLGAGIILMGGIPTPKNLLKRDVLFMLVIFFLLGIFCYLPGGGTYVLGRIDGIILLLLLAAYLIYLFKNQAVLQEELEDDGAASNKFSSLGLAWVMLVAGLIMVFLGAKTMVDNVIWCAERFSLNKALIAATIVAFGTSVPELAVTITGVLKKRNAIALGNIIGSCIFNILLILGLCSIISPIVIGLEMLAVIIPIMVLCGALLVVFMRTGWKLVRMEGIFLLLIYVLFIAYNVVKIR